MKVLLVADNHGQRENLKKILKTVSYDIAIHLGDGEVPLHFLNNHFDYYVCGNHEHWEPFEQLINLGGIKTLIMHGHTHAMALVSKAMMKKLFKKYQVNLILHGHLHIFYTQKWDNNYVICPGSTDYPRGPEGPGYVVLTIEKSQIIDIKHYKINFERENYA